MLPAPDLISWSLRNQSWHLETFRSGRPFAVNILAENQLHRSSLFARNSLIDQFAGVDSKLRRLPCDG